VENDVFLSVDEILSVMWKNGYTEQERNAIQFTFPSDYKFHVPELSVLFDLKEDDVYKFCMRTRMEKSHIGELDWDKVRPRGFLRDHWFVYAGGFYLFKNFPFFNYVFFCKFFGFGVWFWSCWMLFSRYSYRLYRRTDYMLQQKTAQDVMEGEDKIVENMRKFANDGECLDQLKGFKTETQASMAAYRNAIQFTFPEMSTPVHQGMQYTDMLTAERHTRLKFAKPLPKPSNLTHVWVKMQSPPVRDQAMENRRLANLQKAAELEQEQRLAEKQLQKSRSQPAGLQFRTGAPIAEQRHFSSTYRLACEEVVQFLVDPDMKTFD